MILRISQNAFAESLVEHEVFWWSWIGGALDSILLSVSHSLH